MAVLALAACTSVKNFAQGSIRFPKQAVRSLFHRMEQNLALPEGALPPASGLQTVPSAEEASLLGPSSSPGCPAVPAWWPVGVACAQEQAPQVVEATFPHDPEGALLTELRQMIEVEEALHSRRQRDALTSDWKLKGIVGEAKDGQLVFLIDRKEADREILARVANENDDRQIIMRGMAKAVLAINAVEADERNILALTPATIREFSTVRRKLAPEATWVQLPDGQWVKK
jgi:hypothetical protein